MFGKYIKIDREKKSKEKRGVKKKIKNKIIKSKETLKYFYKFILFYN